ncbi:MAG: hypothetical protein IKL36_07715, partial [Clostridia bacterium]|nr:hypothetical protein [Clostridia bacterium]
MKRSTRFLSLALVLVFLLGAVPFTAFEAQAANDATTVEVSSWSQLVVALTSENKLNIIVTSSITESVTQGGDISAIKINGEKTIDLQGNPVLYEWSANVQLNEHAKDCYSSCYTNRGFDDPNKTLFEITKGSKLTINDSVGGGSIRFDGGYLNSTAEGDGDLHYEWFVCRDVFDVYGELVMNGGTIEAGGSRELYYSLVDNITSIFPFSGYAWEQVWGTALNIKNGGKVTIYDGALYGRGMGAWCFDDDESTLSFKRDEVVNIEKGGKIVINSGILNAKGGANIFAGDGVDGGLSIVSGEFKLETLDDIRVYDDYITIQLSYYGPYKNRYNGVGPAIFTEGSNGVLGIPDSAWKGEAGNFTLFWSGKTLASPNELAKVDLMNSNKSATIYVTGGSLVFVDTYPQMPIGQSETHVYMPYNTLLTFQFNNVPLSDILKSNGYTIEKSYVLREKTYGNIVQAVSGLPENAISSFNHTFTKTKDQVSYYTLTFTQTLKKNGTEEKSRTYTYYIYVEPKLSEIKVTKNPNKTVYDINDKLDTTGITVTAYYNDGSSRNVTDSVEFGLSGTPLKQTMTECPVSYFETLFQTKAKTTFPIEVHDFNRLTNVGYVEYFYLDGKPGTPITEAYHGQKVWIKPDIDPKVKINGFTDLNSGTTVYYDKETGHYYFHMQDQEVWLDADVEIIKDIKSVQRLKSPTKSSYVAGEIFDATGLLLEVTYEDDTTEILDHTAVTFDLKGLEAGTTSFRMSFGKYVIDHPITVSNAPEDKLIKYIDFDIDGYSVGNHKNEVLVTSETDGVRVIPSSIDIKLAPFGTVDYIEENTRYIIKFNIEVTPGYDLDFAIDNYFSTLRMKGMFGANLKYIANNTYAVEMSGEPIPSEDYTLSYNANGGGGIINSVQVRG